MSLIIAPSVNPLHSNIVLTWEDYLWLTKTIFPQRDSTDNLYIYKPVTRKALTIRIEYIPFISLR